jgi:hypothetical protein
MQKGSCCIATSLWNFGFSGTPKFRGMPNLAPTLHRNSRRVLRWTAQWTRADSQSTRFDMKSEPAVKREERVSDGQLSNRTWIGNSRQAASSSGCATCTGSMHRPRPMPCSSHKNPARRRIPSGTYFSSRPGGKQAGILQIGPIWQTSCMLSALAPHRCGRGVL